MIKDIAPHEARAVMDKLQAYADRLREVIVDRSDEVLIEEVAQLIEAVSGMFEQDLLTH